MEDCRPSRASFTDLVRSVGGSGEVPRMLEASSGCPGTRGWGALSPVDGRSFLSSVERDVA